MLKILLWVVANDGRFFNGALNILARQHGGIEFVGVTASAPIQLATGDKKIPFIPLTEVARTDSCDVLLVVGARQIGMSKITQVATQLKLDTEKLLGDWIVCIPGFTLDKYRQLQRSRLSIFAMNCFGGFISHTLGLPFRTPIINMFFSEQDFVRFLRAPRICLEYSPHFEKLSEPTVENPDGYPILSLGNISLNMMHYRRADDAISTWNARKTRINWYNLFVMMFAEDEKILREFDALPYGKKVCFVPFKSDVDSAWYVKFGVDKGAKNFIDAVNRFGGGHIF